MIRETITFQFADEEQQKRFHHRLDGEDALKQKAHLMRLAIDRMELALCGALSLIDLPDTWGEPRHRPELGVTPKMTAGEVYQIVDAFKELNTIVNDPEFSPAKFK